MKEKIVLTIDAFINLILGMLLLMFNPDLSKALGVPESNTNFYPNILGGVFIGITIALLIEAFQKKEKYRHGLGFAGAICINICGGLVLTFWLIFGHLNIPLKGEIFLWTLAGLLVIVSTIELLFDNKKSR